MGSFPIAQLREPYSAVRYIAERVDLVKALKLHHPEDEEEWSPMDICEAWARKRQFFTAKAARPDTYRAANHLLRVALDGRILLYIRPPGYFKNKGSDLSMKSFPLPPQIFSMSSYCVQSFGRRILWSNTCTTFARVSRLPLVVRQRRRPSPLQTRKKKRSSQETRTAIAKLTKNRTMTTKTTRNRKCPQGINSPFWAQIELVFL